MCCVSRRKERWIVRLLGLSVLGLPYYFFFSRNTTREAVAVKAAHAPTHGPGGIKTRRAGLSDRACLFVIWLSLSLSLFVCVFACLFSNAVFWTEKILSGEEREGREARHPLVNWTTLIGRERRVDERDLNLFVYFLPPPGMWMREERKTLVDKRMFLHLHAR